MKLGIVGLPGAGKSTIFEALTKNFLIDGRKEESRISALRVPDERVDVLSRMFSPRKTIYARVEYFLPGASGHQKDNAWTKTRDCDALIHVIRNFQDYGMEAALPSQDFIRLDQELSLETDFLCILNSHAQEHRQVIELSLHVAVQEGFITLASTLEHVVLGSEFETDFQHLLHLCTGIGKNVRVGIRRRTVSETRMRKHV